MSENGFDAGWRRIGALALWCIPAALGIGASIWLGVAIGTHQWINTLSQEQRRAIYVGAENRPKEKIKIETPNAGCLKIDRVDLEGREASVYFHNSCRVMQDFIMINWQLISPNGTLLAGDSKYSSLLNGPDMLQSGEHGEVVLSGGYGGIKTDDRTAAVRLTMTGRTER
jgi:hypothetical protein